MHMVERDSGLLKLSKSGVGGETSNTKGAFFWDYFGIGILGIDGISVLLGAIPFRNERNIIPFILLTIVE